MFSKANSAKANSAKANSAKANSAKANSAKANSAKANSSARFARLAPCEHFWGTVRRYLACLTAYHRLTKAASESNIAWPTCA